MRRSHTFFFLEIDFFHIISFHKRAFCWAKIKRLWQIEYILTERRDEAYWRQIWQPGDDTAGRNLDDSYRENLR